jgi:SET domain-containing protein
MRRMKGQDGKRVSELEAERYIDGSVGGNQTQYINHSCDPNADAFVIGGSLFIFALRQIAPGEEITVDYLNSFEQDHSVCQCRTASCRQRNIQKAA